jgi:hypothetical protein
VKVKVVRWDKAGDYIFSLWKWKSKSRIRDRIFSSQDNQKGKGKAHPRIGLEGQKGK